MPHGGWDTEPLAPSSVASRTGSKANTSTASNTSTATAMLGALIIMLTESRPLPSASVIETAMLEASMSRDGPRYAARLVA